jgi:hypothetical protein
LFALGAERKLFMLYIISAIFAVIGFICRGASAEVNLFILFIVVSLLVLVTAIITSFASTSSVISYKARIIALTADIAVITERYLKEKQIIDEYLAKHPLDGPLYEKLKSDLLLSLSLPEFKGSDLLLSMIHKLLVTQKDISNCKEEINRQTQYLDWHASTRWITGRFCSIESLLI